MIATRIFFDPLSAVGQVGHRYISLGQRCLEAVGGWKYTGLLKPGCDPSRSTQAWADVGTPGSPGVEFDCPGPEAVGVPREHRAGLGFGCLRDRDLSSGRSGWHASPLSSHHRGDLEILG